jgi:hypothetical protein
MGTTDANRTSDPRLGCAGEISWADVDLRAPALVD